jgi:hypothetical protein
MAKTRKPVTWKFAEAREAASDMATEGFDDERVTLVSEQYLELYAEYTRLFDKLTGRS